MPIKTIGGDFLFVIIVWVSLNMASVMTAGMVDRIRLNKMSSNKVD